MRAQEVQLRSLSWRLKSSPKEFLRTKLSYLPRSPQLLLPFPRPQILARCLSHNPCWWKHCWNCSKALNVCPNILTNSVYNLAQTSILTKKKSIFSSRIQLNTYVGSFLDSVPYFPSWCDSCFFLGRIYYHYLYLLTYEWRGQRQQKDLVVQTSSCLCRTCSILRQYWSQHTV